jgi:hypothetical protein
MDSPTFTEGTMRVTIKDVLELRKQLDFINTGMFVSILPDEMIDLHPEDNEVLEAVGYLVDELYYSIYRDVRRPETPLSAPEPRVVRTINDLCFNVVAHAMYELWAATTRPPTDTDRVRRALEVCSDFEKFLLATFPNPDEDG